MSSYFEQLEQEFCGALDRGAHLPVRRRLASRAQARLGLGPAPGALGRPWARAALGIVGVGAAAAIVLSIVNLGAGTQQAFAGWSASPTAPTAGETAAAEAACQPKLSSPMNAASELAHIDASGWQAMVSDTRGPYTMLYYESSDGNARAICLNGTEGTVLSAGEASSKLAQETPSPAAAGISISLSREASEGSPSGEEHSYAEIAGRTGSEVSGVTLVLSDGSHVAASTNDGRFLAWWPGTAHAVSAEVATSSGTSTQPLQKE